MGISMKRGMRMIMIIPEEMVNESFGAGKSLQRGKKKSQTRNGDSSSHTGSAVEGFVTYCRWYFKEAGEGTGQIHARGKCFYQ